MFWKDEICKYIMSHNCSYDELIVLSKIYPTLRVKTIDAKGRVPVIQLSERGEWMKPIEWANLHLQSLIERYSESQQRIIDCGSDPTTICGATCSLVEKLEERPDTDKYLKVSETCGKLLESLRNLCEDTSKYIFELDEDLDVEEEAIFTSYLKEFLKDEKIRFYLR